MADMIVKVARTSENDVKPRSTSLGLSGEQTQRPRHPHTLHGNDDDMHIGPKNTAVIAHHQPDYAQQEHIQGISRQRDVQIYVGDSGSDFHTEGIEHGKEQSRSRQNSHESQVPLKDLGRLTETR